MGSWSRNRSHFGARSCACSSASSERSAGLRMGTKILRTVLSPSLLPLSSYTLPYNPLPVRRLHHHITCSPSTSSSWQALPFSTLAGCFTTTPSFPPHTLMRHRSYHISYPRITSNGQFSKVHFTSQSAPLWAQALRCFCKTKVQRMSVPS